MYFPVLVLARSQVLKQISFIKFTTHCLLCILLLFSSLTYGNTRPWNVTFGGLYLSEDKENLNSDASWLLIPFSVKYRLPNWELQLAGSYLRSDNSFEKKGPDQTSGIGDTVLKIKYLKASPVFEHWWLDFSAKAKFPTADDETNIGTNERDYWLEMEAFRIFRQTWYSHFGIGRKFRGSNAQYNLQDSYYGSASLGFKKSSRHSFGITVDFMQASQKMTTDIGELTPYSSHRLNRKQTLVVYLIKGLTKSSTDYGGGIQISYSFGKKST